jgi:hypothetical protein
MNGDVSRDARATRLVITRTSRPLVSLHAPSAAAPTVVASMRLNHPITAVVSGEVGPTGLAAPALDSRLRGMNKSVALAVALTAVFGVSLAANAACRSADAPASTAPSPAPASVLSPAPIFAPPPNAKPVEPPTSDEPQHFCCDEVGEGKKGKGGGTNCTAINKELINQCTELLFCSGNYYRKKGDVTCL